MNMLPNCFPEMYQFTLPYAVNETIFLNHLPPYLDLNVLVVSLMYPTSFVGVRMF